MGNGEVKNRVAHIDAVLVYAQPGSGKRASLFTHYTFAFWDGGELVPFGKAYSGLSDEEIRRVDAFVRRNTLEKFGRAKSNAATRVRTRVRNGTALETP